MACYLVVLVLTLLCLLAGLGAVIGGAYGSAWYTTGVVERGLWKSCGILLGISACETRKDLFEFDKHIQFDLILAILIGSCVFCLIAAFSTLFMFCCQRSPGAWRCCALLVAIMAFLSACGTIGAVGYNEHIGQLLYKLFDHGWSNTIVWVGGGLQFIGSILAYVLICASPIRVLEGQIVQPGYNRGFELR